MFLGAANYIKMPDMEHIEHARSVSNLIFFHFLKSF